MKEGLRKLLLVPCSGKETAQLARSIYNILRKDYGLDNQVELLLSQQNQETRGRLKNHQHPLALDLFPDMEVRADIGRNELKDVVRGKHVVVVEHLLTPNRKVDGKDGGNPQIVSVNDHLMAVRGLLNIINNVDTLQMTGVFPYLFYVRAHSLKKYEARGFFQFNSLETTLADLQRGGLKALLTIDPHSPKAAQAAEELDIDFHGVNPFQSGRSINPYKLGLSGEKAKEVLKRLRPFHERLNQLKTENPDHLYLVSVDDGTERRTENFTERAFAELPPEEAYSKIIYFDKDRVTLDSAVTGFKHFSQINESNIDSEGTYVLIDDMYASGGTTDKVAKVLKAFGAKRVEAWVSHAVTMPLQHEKANKRDSIDQVVCLDTVPQHPGLDAEYIKASADLLAAELYKTHHRLLASR